MVGVTCVHATKLDLVMAAIVVTGSVDLPSVGEDVSKSTLDAKFAVSLDTVRMSLQRKGLHNAYPPTFEKYLQGALSVVASKLWEKGHALPAWQAPCL